MNQTLCLLVMLLFIPEGEVSALTLASTALFQPTSTTTTSSQIETAPDQTAATASVTATSSHASTRTRTTTETTHQPDLWSFSSDILYYWEWAFSIAIWVGLTVFFVVLGIKKKIYLCFCYPTCYRVPQREIQ